MKLTKLSITLVLAGALLAGIGLLRGTNPAPAAAPPALTSTAALTPVSGLAPIADVVDLFQERSNANPVDYLSRTQLGQALHAQAKQHADLEGFENAELVLRSALEINDRWAPAQLALAQALHAQHQFGEAREIAQLVLDRDASSLGALALLGDANLELGDLDAASELYRQLVEAERSAPVVSRLARLASSQGDTTGGVTFALEALELSDQLALRPSDQAFYWFQAGRMYFDNGDADAALSHYARAREIDAGNAAATEAMAWAYVSTQQHAKAIVLYQELIATGPAPDLYGSMANAFDAIGESEQATDARAVGLELAEITGDRFPAERRHLTSFYLDIDADHAVRLAQADLVERQDWAAFDMLVWALHQAGRVDEAAAVIVDGPAGDPPHAAMKYHYAAVLSQIGDDDRALALATAALAQNPNFHPTQADDARRLITELSG